MKHQVIIKKQCELFGSLGQLEKCMAVSKPLLLRNEKELTKYVLKVLSPWLSQMNPDNLHVVMKKR